MHLETVLEDTGPGYAARFPQGRGSKLATLSVKGKTRAEVDALSKLTHADVHALRFLAARREGIGGEVDRGEYNVWPAVDQGRAESILYVVAYETVAVAVSACEVFGFGIEIPPWISNKLRRLGELAARRS